MAKGIKKFDQEIRVVSSILSMNNVSSGFTGDLSSNSANTNGAFYVNSDAPWFANATNTYQLASNVQVSANTADIATLSARTFENGLTNSGNVVKLGGTLTNNTTINGDTSYSFTVDDITALNMIVDTDSYLSLAPNSFNIFSANFVGITGSDTQVEIQAAGNDHILITGTGVELGDQAGTYILVENANGIKIDGADNNVSVTTDGIATFGSTTNNLYFDPTNNAVQMNVDGSTFTIDGGTPGTFIGFEYIDDYSAQFTDNSLITKLYVDSAITSIPASDNYYLTGVTISNGVLTYDLANTTSSVTFDITDQLTLDMLSGVTINTGTLEDGDFLIWNSGTAQWEASGLTEDSLIAGDGINFDTGTVGQVTINSILAGTGGTWIASDGTTDHNVLFTEKISFLGGGDTTVVYDNATSAFTFTTNTSTFDYNWIFNGTTINSGDTVDISAGTGLVTGGTATNLTLGLDPLTVTDINNAISSITFDTATETLTYTNNNGDDDTVDMTNTWVQLTGDDMTGALNIGTSILPVTNALQVYGETLLSGQTTIMGDLYVSGTTVTVDTENLAITDNVIILNSGQTGSGVSRGTAGISIDRGSAADYVFVFDENQGDGETFRVGMTGDTQAVATREDGMKPSALTYWNESESRMDSIRNYFDTGLDRTLTTNDIVIFSGGSWVYYNADSLVNGANSWSTITTDSGDITVNSANQIMNLIGGDLIETSGVDGTDTITISHSAITSTLTIETTSANTFISSMTFDNFGHITAYSTEYLDFSSLDFYKTFTTDYGIDVVADGNDDSIAILGTDMISTTGSSDKIEIGHNTITNTNISGLANNEYVNGLTFDAFGHITATSTATSVLFVSGDTGSLDALNNNGIYISGGTGIVTRFDGNTLVIDSSSNEELVTISLTDGTSQSSTDTDTTINANTKAIIIDYYIAGDQEGQIRMLNISGVWSHTNDYQGDADVDFTGITVTSNQIVFTYDKTTTANMTYFVKQVIQ